MLSLTPTISEDATPQQKSNMSPVAQSRHLYQSNTQFNSKEHSFIPLNESKTFNEKKQSLASNHSIYLDIKRSEDSDCLDTSSSGSPQVDNFFHQNEGSSLEGIKARMLEIRGESQYKSVGVEEKIHFQGLRRHSTIESYHSQYSLQPQFQEHSTSLLSPQMSSSSGSLNEICTDIFSSSHDNLNYKYLSSPFYPDSTSLLTLPKKISLYKTELCRTFEETGYCRYGVKCQFAHDKAELRVIPRHPRYKTEICRTFWELGNCPYGKRCCFIHLEAGTLMNGKPPGQAKLGLDNQFNGPVAQGFQKDQSFKSTSFFTQENSSLSYQQNVPSQYPNYHAQSLISMSFQKYSSPTTSGPVPPQSMKSGFFSNNLHQISPPQSRCKEMEMISTQSAVSESSRSCEWMRSRRSQSLGLPNPSAWTSFDKTHEGTQTKPFIDGLLETSMSNLTDLGDFSANKSFLGSELKKSAAFMTNKIIGNNNCADSHDTLFCSCQRPLQ